MCSVMCYACSEVVDYLYDDLSVLLPRLVEKFEANPLETELALLALMYDVMEDSDIIDIS